MLVRIEAKDRREADCIKRGMDDPKVRAFVIVVGALLALPSDRARERVLNFVRDMFDEINGRAS